MSDDLHFEAGSGNLEQVKALIEGGMDINAKDDRAKPPFTKRPPLEKRRYVMIS